MRTAPCLDSTISAFPRQLKVAPRGRLDIISLPLQPSLEAPAGRQNCGCSSVVERLVANEKVASSTLVTRSNPESFRGVERRAPKRCEGGPPEKSQATAGRPNAISFSK